MRDWLIAETDPPHWQAWGQLHEAVRSGRTVVPELFGMHIYDYYAAHPADLAYFSSSDGQRFGAGSRRHCPHYDFRGLDTSPTVSRWRSSPAILG
jgi:hypothetical protein